MGWIGEDGEPSEAARQAFKTPEQGASTTVWVATSKLLDGRAGVYCEDVDIAAMFDPDGPGFSGVKPHACDDANAERLWEISEGLLATA